MAIPEKQFETRRWLHDKFERLQAREEDRIQSWATLFISLNTGLVAIVGFWLNQYHVTTGFWEFLAPTAAAGFVISTGWFLVGYRINESNMVWREMAHSIEAEPYGVAEDMPANVRLWWGENRLVPMMLSRPMTEKDRVVDERVRASRGGGWFFPVALLAKGIPKGTAIAWAVVLAVSLFLCFV